MTDYVKSTNFASKDSLSIGNPLKIVKGTEIDTEFNNIATAVATKADIANPTFTGVASAPTAGAGTNTTQLATTAFVTDAVATGKVNTALTGVPTAPTASTGTNTTQLATTAFVTDAVATGKVNTALTGVPTAPTATVNTNTTQVATTAFVTAQIADDAPTKTGTGASGTWGINITGNAATATTAAACSGNAATATTDSLHFGVGQTWQDVGASRAANTTYVNTTGKPIMVNIYWAGSNGIIVATVNGVGFTISSNGGFSMAGNVIVPTGATYSINAFSTWHELR
jgi:hypothetical protein